MDSKNKEFGEVTVDGFRLRYVIDGKGFDAIVIGSSVYYPRTFSQSLRAVMRLIFMDHRGFGQALRPFTHASFELDVLVDDIETVRSHLGLSQLVLIGHSGHGYIALEYAKKYPERVSHVILIAMSPDGSQSAFAAADQYFDDSVCPKRKTYLAKSLANLERDMEVDPSRAFMTRLLKFGPMIWYRYDFDATYLWEGVEIVPEMFEYVWGTVFAGIDITKDLDTIKASVFLALGRYDYWNPPNLWQKVRGAFSDLTVRVFEKSGHAPQFEQPELFDAELVRWLKENEVA